MPFKEKASGVWHLLVPSVPVLSSPGSSGILPDLPALMAGELDGSQLMFLSLLVS